MLLEALEAAGIGRRARSSPPSEPVVRARAGIVATQRRLLDPALAPAARAALLAELERRALDEAALLARAEGLPGSRSSEGPSLVTLDEVRRRLHPDEVMLVFLVGLDEDLYGAFGGGSWVVSVSRDRAIARRVPDRLRLEATVPVFAGLLERRDGSEGPASVALYRELFGAADGTDGVLGPDIRRVVVIPDGVLHELPFAALRAAPDAPPLGVRYEIAVVPSATLWSRWRSGEGSKPPAAVLAVADPDLAGRQSAAALERGGILAAGLDLGPLPYARREGARVRRALGGASRLLAGRAATESAVKSTALGPFGVSTSHCRRGR